MTTISEKAMVLNLSIGLWQGYRLDKEATQKVTEDAGADSDAARVNKHLVPKAVLKDVTSAAAAIRVHFYDKTLPWKDNGDRLLPRQMYTTFIERHEKLVGDFNDAVNKFLTRGYLDAVEQAGFRMGELFDMNDYPSPAVLKRKFYVDIDIDVVTEAGDFRVQLDEDDVGRIRQSMERAMNERLGKAIGDVWERLAKVVGHLADKLADEDKIFRNSTVDNVRELLEVLPGLNVLNDPDLVRVGKEIGQMLDGISANDLRKDAAQRSAVAADAKRIMDDMAGFMNAFSKAA